MTPLFICTGILRSGSTWSFNVCRLLAQALATQRRQPFASAYLLDNELERFLQSQGSSIPGPTVIKAHKVGPLAFEYLHSGRAKAVCTFRDPRDCAVSMRTFYGGNINDIALGIATGLEFLKLYQMSAHTLFVRYEDMMTDAMQEIQRIAAHVQIDLTEDVLQRIERQTDISSSKQICQELKHRAENSIRRSGTHRVDPLTNLHDNHIFSGKSGRWRLELTSDEARSLTQLFRPWLLDLGYEKQESLAALEEIWRSVSATAEPPMAASGRQTPPPAAPGPARSPAPLSRR